MYYEGIVAKSKRYLITKKLSTQTDALISIWKESFLILISYIVAPFAMKHIKENKKGKHRNLFQSKN